MAFLFGTYTADNASDFNTTTVTVGKPAGIVEGDLMLTFLFSGDTNPSTQSVTTLSGWTLIQSHPSDNSGLSQINVYRKVAGGSEPADYTWVQSLSQRFYAVCVELTGADTADIVDVSAGFSDDEWDVNIVCPSVNATDADGLLVTMFGSANTDATTPPGGHTELFNVEEEWAGMADGGGIGYEILTSSGATGTRTHVRDSGANRDATLSFIINAADAPVGDYGRIIDLNTRESIRVVR